MKLLVSMRRLQKRCPLQGCDQACGMWFVFMKNCGFEASNGRASLPPALNGSHFKSRRIPPLPCELVREGTITSCIRWKSSSASMYKAGWDLTNLAVSPNPVGWGGRGLVTWWLHNLHIFGAFLGLVAEPQTTSNHHFQRMLLVSLAKNDPFFGWFHAVGSQAITVFFLLAWQNAFAGRSFAMRALASQGKLGWDLAHFSPIQFSDKLRNLRFVSPCLLSFCTIEPQDLPNSCSSVCVIPDWILPPLWDLGATLLSELEEELPEEETSFMQLVSPDSWLLAWKNCSLLLKMETPQLFEYFEWGKMI